MIIRNEYIILSLSIFSNYFFIVVIIWNDIGNLKQKGQKEKEKRKKNTMHIIFILDKILSYSKNIFKKLFYVRIVING